MTKPEIQKREDIALLVNTFYTKVQKNDTLSVYFSEVANVNWEKHLPVMYDFWSSILLNIPVYLGNPLEKHIDLHNKKPLTQLAFKEWELLFHQTVDELYMGKVANKAKLTASKIARIMQTKIIPGE